MKIEIGTYCLRDWRKDDLADVAGYANNPKIAANLRDGFPSPYTLEDAKQFLDRVFAQNPRTFFAIAAPGEAIGGIGLMLGRDVHRCTAELGYWLAEPFWGKGIMTSAVIAFTEYGMQEYGLNRVHAGPYCSNVASIRVLEKAGFVFEGRMRASVLKNNEILDQCIYARIRQGI